VEYRSALKLEQSGILFGVVLRGIKQSALQRTRLPLYRRWRARQRLAEIECCGRIFHYVTTLKSFVLFAQSIFSSPTLRHFLVVRTNLSS
jgi:hypothetical protein